MHFYMALTHPEPSSQTYNSLTTSSPLPSHNLRQHPTVQKTPPPPPQTQLPHQQHTLQHITRRATCICHARHPRGPHPHTTTHPHKHSRHRPRPKRTPPNQPTHAHRPWPYIPPTLSQPRHIRASPTYNVALIQPHQRHHRTKGRQTSLGSRPPTQRGHARNLRGCYPTSRGRSLQYRSRRCRREPGTRTLPAHVTPPRRRAGHKRSRRPRRRRGTTPPPHQGP